MDETPARRIAIIVNPSVPIGMLGNAIAVVSIGIGASAPQLGGHPLTDGVGRSFRSSAVVAVPVLQASPAEMLMLLDQCRLASGIDTTVAFPEFARGVHDFATYRDKLGGLDLTAEPLASIGVAGDTGAVKRLTKRLRLLS